MVAVGKAEGGFDGHPPLNGMTESYTGSERRFQLGPDAAQLLNVPKRKKPPELQRAFQNVDLALTRFRAGHTQVFLSDSNHLERLGILVAGVGFEPTTFRL